LPNPSASTLGGIESIAATTHSWIDSISTAGVPHQSRPACGDLSDSGGNCQLQPGTGLAASGSNLNLQPAAASTIGGVESITSLTHNWIAYIDTLGVPHQSQPAFSDLSGAASAAQLPAATPTTQGAVVSGCTPYTPTDQSGAGLTFAASVGEYCLNGPAGGQTVTVFFAITYPSTASPSNAAISAPVAIPNALYAAAAGILMSSLGNGRVAQASPNSSKIVLVSQAGVAITNASLTGAVITGSVTYPAQ
jgi:hypothetical protein